MTEADTCREFVTHKLVEAGWGVPESVIGEQHSFSGGRVIVAGGKVRRGKQRRADYLLHYRHIAIQRVIESMLRGQRRILATLATGTGKTCVALLICWKFWSSRWNRTSEYRRPKILFLADRNILVDDPMAKMFAPFGDARHKIADGDVSQSRDMYVSIYQALSTSTEDVFR